MGEFIFDSGPGALDRALNRTIGRLLGPPKRPPHGATLGDPVEDLVALQARLADLPPAVARIMTSHAVPYGRAYRQWMTNGDLIVWANRGEIEALPRTKYTGCDIRVGDLSLPPSIIGIPVVNA